MKKEERRPFLVDSSGRPGRSVSPRTHRRGSPLRRACPNKLRCTLEDAGEPCFSASPHRHGRASPLHQNLPLSPCHTVSQKTTNNSSSSGRAPEDRWESAGELGFFVSPRTHRRRSPIRRVCPNKSTKSVNTRMTENRASPRLRTDIEELRLFATSAQKLSPRSRR